MYKMFNNDVIASPTVPGDRWSVVPGTQHVTHPAVCQHLLHQDPQTTSPVKQGQ